VNVLLSWSSGKDSAWSLHQLRKEKNVQVVALVTSFNSTADRVAMHAVRRKLVEAQAERTGLPLWTVDLPSPCSNAEYEKRMSSAWRRAVEQGISAVAFGDLFLTDIREYREKQLAGTGLEPLFPLWGLPTKELAREMVEGGISAKLTCVDPSKLDKSYAGRKFDLSLIESLPPGIDPCGENGEFHTFVYEAPVLTHPIRVRTGEIVERDGFVFADVIENGCPDMTTGST
jgi:uncharacterized protein (TIGR00290 family)